MQKRSAKMAVAVLCLVMVPVVAGYAAEASAWKRQIGAGYNQSNGNTKKAGFSLAASADRKTAQDEINLKGSIFNSSSNRRLDGQKWYTLGRYGYNIVDETWFLFGKVEGDHDRFANINYRVIPSAGLGYQFANSEDWKALAELGAGISYTKFLDGTKSATDPMITTRLFLDRRLIKASHLTEDVTMYSSTKGANKYRVHSETAFNNPIAENLLFKVSFIDDYNNAPSNDAKKNDTQLITSINYAF